MNQILYKRKIKNQSNNKSEYGLNYNTNDYNFNFGYNYNLNHTFIVQKRKFIIIFFVAIITIIISICFYIFLKYRLSKNEKFSKKLVSNYSVITLFSNPIDNYSINDINDQNSNKTIINSNNNINNSAEPFIIGLIQIDKIKLIYPILSTTTDELLKISPCRFAGPMPNQVGNLCIAGHNYVDNKLFSKLYVLNIGDNIKIYDLSSNMLEYKIYYKEEILYNDLSCTNQDTNNKKEITLITCNNVSGNRLCIKAKEE